MTDDSGYEAGDEPKLNRIADMVDDLAAEIRNQLGESEQRTANFIKRIQARVEAIQTAIYRP